MKQLKSLCPALGLALLAALPLSIASLIYAQAPAPSPSGVAVEVESFATGPIGVLIRDPLTGAHWNNADRRWDNPGGPIDLASVALACCPLTPNNPLTGIFSGVVHPDPPIAASGASVYAFALPVNEVKQLLGDLKATGGTLGLNGPNGNATVPFNADAVALQTAMDTIYGAGSSAVSGGPLPAAVQVSFMGDWSARSVPSPVLTTSTLVGGANYGVRTLVQGQPLQRLAGIAQAWPAQRVQVSIQATAGN